MHFYYFVSEDSLFTLLVRNVIKTGYFFAIANSDVALLSVKTINPWLSCLNFSACFFFNIAAYTIFLF